MYLLDTCTLVWWTSSPDFLSTKAKEACIKTENQGGVISSISIWEVGIKIKRGQLDIGLTIREFHERIQKLGYLSIIPVSDTIWIENLLLKWDHKDPADRTIVATAKMGNDTIITPDRAICAFYSKTCW